MSKKTVLLIILWATIFPVVIQAAILNVPAYLPTIQMAIDACASGDTVLIAPGNYEENISVSNMSITLASQYITSLDSATIHATRLSSISGMRVLRAELTNEDTLSLIGLLFESSEFQNYRAIEVESAGGFVYMDHCYVCNFTSGSHSKVSLYGPDVHLTCCAFVANGDSTGISTVAISQGFTWIDHCYFGANASESGGALRCHCLYLSLESSIFENNYASWYGGALWLQCAEGEAYLHRNRFISNRSEVKGFAVFISSLDTLVIDDCLFAQNEGVGGSAYGGALALSSESDQFEVARNGFLDNHNENSGAAVCLQADTDFHDNLVAGNRAKNFPAMLVYHVNDYSTKVEAWNNRFIGNGPYDLDDDYYTGAIVARDELDTLLLFNNDIVNNNGYVADKIENDLDTAYVNAPGNYWGHMTGPHQPMQNHNGLGDSVASTINVLPFSQIPLTSFNEPDPFALLYPPDDGMNDTLPVRFAWETAFDIDPADQVDYLLEISEDLQFTNPKQYYFIEGTSRIVRDILLGRSYYWRVTAFDNVWQSQESEIRSVYLTDVELAPRPFSLIFPQDNYPVNYEDLTFQWSTAYDFTTRDVVRYSLEYDTTQQFTSSTRLPAGVDTTLLVPWETWRDSPQYYWRVIAIDQAGHQTVSTETWMVHLATRVEEEKEKIPTKWNLLTCYPNPFNSETGITVSVPETGMLSVIVYDVLGRHIDTIYSGKTAPGFHRFVWNAADKPAGCYFLQVSNCAGWKENRKIVFLK